MSFRTLLRKQVCQSVFVIFILEKPLSALADDAGNVRIKSISPKMFSCPVDVCQRQPSLLYPRNKVVGGYTGFTMSVRL
jgi:hypothetical protein